MFNIIFKIYLLRVSIINFLDILKFYPKQLVVITNIGYTRWHVYECSVATFRIVLHYPLSSKVFNCNLSILFDLHDLFFLWDPKNPWGETVAVDSEIQHSKIVDLQHTSQEFLILNTSFQRLRSIVDSLWGVQVYL